MPLANVDVAVVERMLSTCASTPCRLVEVPVVVFLMLPLVLVIPLDEERPLAAMLPIKEEVPDPCTAIVPVAVRPDTVVVPSSAEPWTARVAEGVVVPTPTNPDPVTTKAGEVVP